MVYPTDEETFDTRNTPEFIAEGHLNDIQALLKRMQDYFGYGGRVNDSMGIVNPIGSIIAFAGSSAPDGWLMCDGANYSRTHEDYSALYAVIGVNYGAQEPATFNVPDLRGKFLRGMDDSETIIRAQTFFDLVTNEIYCPGHTFHRTAFPVRVTSDDTLPTPLLINTTYWTSFTDVDYIGFSTTKANSLVPTLIDITNKGAGNISIIPWLEVDRGSRTKLTKASGAGVNIGSYQEDSFQAHYHSLYRRSDTPIAADSAGFYIDSSINPTKWTDAAVKEPVQWGDFGPPRYTVESRGINVYVNYIIKR